MTTNDEIDDLLEDWYDWQQSYRPKLGYGGADPACREYRSGWRESSDLAEAADMRARKAVCEAVDACVSRLDLRGRVAIQTEMRNRVSGARSWSSIRLQTPLADEYARAKEFLRPMFEARDLVETAK
ncbi:hypothetical protein QZM93_38295 [Burkholderia cepacia]|uniref:hypothetical protein n=1 Tax=Burkholderia cepacia TaxID=292 RepID=UPI0011AD158F|nr:hypothetical protein [Burkholderia cepacia]MDN7894454.1 hypothetical protein [Burkholderia cepacia]